MSWQLHRHDARRVSEIIAPESVDLIVTSPPYFALRSYRDNSEHFPGQLGSEATPGEFVDNLIACTADWLKVLKPSGSLFVNLGDKYTSTMYGRLGNPRTVPQPNGEWSKQGRHGVHDVATTINPGKIPNKSRMGLPWRYAIRCIDELGLILRADIIWSKPNGLPESVTDRVRMSHECLFHFTRQGRYFAAIDEIREPHTGPPVEHFGTITAANVAKQDERTDGLARTSIASARPRDYNPLGKAPGSVWQIPSEPLTVPDHLGVDHFAAYPSELVRRCVLGWSPSGWCTACGEARRPVVDKTLHEIHTQNNGHSGKHLPGDKRAHQLIENDPIHGATRTVGETVATITGYACACTTPDAPTTPAVVLDPFTGTGTTVLVADQLGRHGIGVDLSADYLRLAEWRIRHDTRTHRKVRDRSGLATPQPPAVDGQLDLFGEPA